LGAGLGGVEVVRFGVQSEAEPASAFEVVLGGGCQVDQQQQSQQQTAQLADSLQKQLQPEGQGCAASPSNNSSSKANVRYAMHSPGSRGAAARTMSEDATELAAAAVVAGHVAASAAGAQKRKTVSHHDDEYADEGFEDHEAEFEEEEGDLDGQDSDGVDDETGAAEELRQRQRIMQLVAEMSM
jgi:hypothetical protein